MAQSIRAVAMKNDKVTLSAVDRMLAEQACRDLVVQAAAFTDAQSHEDFAALFTEDGVLIRPRPGAHPGTGRDHRVVPLQAGRTHHSSPDKQHFGEAGVRHGSPLHQLRFTLVGTGERRRWPLRTTRASAPGCRRIRRYLVADASGLAHSEARSPIPVIQREIGVSDPSARASRAKPALCAFALTCAASAESVQTSPAHPKSLGLRQAKSTTVTRHSEPKPMRLDLGLRLPDDGQRHLRCRAKGGDVAIGQSVGIVLAAVLDLKIQPRAPAFAAYFAAVGFAGQVHPGAGAVLDPIAVDAERRVYVQAEALGVASFGQADPELRQTERHFHALGQAGGGIAAHQFG